MGITLFFRSDHKIDLLLTHLMRRSNSCLSRICKPFGSVAFHSPSASVLIRVTFAKKKHAIRQHQKLKLSRIFIKLQPVQALIGLIQNPEYWNPRINRVVIKLTWNFQNNTKGGYHAFFSLRSKNRFASNSPHEEEQLLLISNQQTVCLCGFSFSVSVRFN